MQGSDEGATVPLIDSPSAPNLSEERPVQIELFIAKTPALATPGAIFEEMTARALHALERKHLGSKHAWALCEYLDCVDAGDIAFDRPTYRQAVCALGEYLTSASAAKAKDLADKSWAALTLLRMLEGERTQGLPSLRLAA